MKKLFGLCALLAAASAALSPAQADFSAFSKGPVFEDFGPVADVDADFEIPEGTEFKIVYDTNKGAAPGQLNKTLVTAARFFNMHARAGVPEENIALAIVVHGKAVQDLTGDAHYAEAMGGENANAPLLAALMEKNVRVIVCGQSAAYYGVTKEDLLPGVEMAISAMTVHSVLQNQGYTLNPF
ncbi:DsrE family protein [Hyphococcus luteus]|uniref:Uncharacterized protein n=1 Tax=Hyphococcus luteus TaxID=2058213 RepID=A0A2S7K897_9PROT|nr:DsrE family protein [Marinicaulis flavus]PQA88734.1 hypothetical protein CW354_10715 [Marinicaulis flavus]